MKRPLHSALLLFALGCAPTPVDVQIGFPSVETFLYSEFGRLFVYEVESQSGLGDCPMLLDGVGRGDFGTPALDSEWQPICAFRDRAVQFPDVPPGPHAYVMVARDETNTVLLSGCRVAEAYEGAPAVEITVYPTPDYARTTAGRTLMCSSPNDKCQRGCR